ncbi:hypothetical protein BDZ89DRAFT_443982 [Hymenopellis radicata]|nr:hypothetical protein BDZ89DRAFT_443982 [Hymenopellis radicata]
MMEGDKKTQDALIVVLMCHTDCPTDRLATISSVDGLLPKALRRRRVDRYFVGYIY